jgi:hypothetical protein
MKQKTYSIFGAGAAGLYTAWRLLNGETKNEKDKNKQLVKGDVLELYDWGEYDFKNKKERAAGARICTWHYKNDPTRSYLELGGMRYSAWDTKATDHNNGVAPGHRLVTTVISKLQLDKLSVPFNESTNPLYSLRARNMYLNGINSNNPAPYNANNYEETSAPDNNFTTLEDLAVTPATALKMTRKDWCRFYQNGIIQAETGASSVFQKGDKIKDIGYWNLMFDQLGSEGFNYTADGNGYTSNIINWNSAVAIQANNEFTPGNQYKTLTTGYSYMFNALFEAIEKLAKQKGIEFNYIPNTRLHSILQVEKEIQYTIATRKNPNKKSASKKTDAAWLAMPRAAIDLVAQATRYQDHKAVDVLNHPKVQLYLEAAIMQPSYKVGMFFDEPWWADTVNTPYPAQLESYQFTTAVLEELKRSGFPEKYCASIQKNATLMTTPYTPASDFVNAVEQCIEERLSVKQANLLLAKASCPTIGPSVTDMPIRQVVYFGNNATDKKAKPVYGILASYDDEQFESFWQELEIPNDTNRKIAISENYQPLDGPRHAPDVMVKMLRKQLAALHFGAGADYNMVPPPIETRYMDWGLSPFGAGYHAWAAHYNIADVQNKIRKPSQLIDKADANIFIVGECYSNDQAWVEGAYCTAESVLNDFFGIRPIIDNTNYPFISPIIK